MNTSTFDMTPAQPRVVVLMSTYNGERYVAEQLHSILQQLPPGGRILVRDDGSRDGTAACVEAYSDARVTLVRGANLGFGGSFLTLLTMAPADVDMVMFADQDDVWLPGKIKRAREALHALGDGPALYGSAQLLVDEALRPLQATRPWPSAPSFQGALVENVITGCTAAMNGAAVRLLQDAGVPEGVRFHDWWSYLVVSAFGKVVFDPEPTLMYRQHSSNQIGHGAGWWGRQRQIVAFLRRHDWVGILLAQVAAMQRHYGASLPAPARALMQHSFETTARGAIEPAWRLVFSAARWRQWRRDELPLRILLAAHRLRLWHPGSQRRAAVVPSADT